MEETITISKEEYEKLVDDSNFLKRLQNLGIQNWDGYKKAISDEFWDKETHQIINLFSLEN